jgi:hypothetical protein
MSEPNEQRWYHVVLTTYGAWLYGDRRGFRTRHHREHVEGDYKNPPPPEQYAAQERRSRMALKQDVVTLPAELRRVVGSAIKERLIDLGALLIAIAVAPQHIHFLAKMPAGKQRAWSGFAKRHGWFVLRAQGWVGKLWGKRSKAVPVRDRTHQLNAFEYIKRHVEEGAWVWIWTKEGGKELLPTPERNPEE